MGVAIVLFAAAAVSFVLLMRESARQAENRRLLTTASLAAFAAHYPTSRFAAERFRPNILLDTGRLEGFVESGWIGRVLAVGEHLSLEFETDDLPAVRACIGERYPDWKAAPAGIASVVRFGGEDFTFQNDWDDPCLISSSSRGDELLRIIHAAVRHG